MSILGFIFLGFLIYLLYRLVFNIILPIYRTTKQVKKSFREMHERMNQHQYQGDGAEPHAEQNASGKKLNTDNLGEYIDFEEVK